MCDANKFIVVIARLFAAGIVGGQGQSTFTVFPLISMCICVSPHLLARNTYKSKSASSKYMPKKLVPLDQKYRTGPVNVKTDKY